MSKIGEKAIEIPQSVVVEVKNDHILIKGKEGEINYNLPEGLLVFREKNTVIIKRKFDDKKTRALHGLYRSLIANAILGVEKPWEKQLELVGTGYNVKLQGEDLVFKLGYSHPVVFKKLPGIKYKVEGNNKVIVIGADKQLVGQTAYQIKIIKKPDVYKGKGIKYKDEKLRIKPGKKVKAV